MGTAKLRARGVPPSLAAEELFTTTDVAEAARLMGKVLAPAFVVPTDPAAVDFSATMHGVRLHDVSVLYLDIRGGATVVIAHSGPYFAVHLPLNARAAGTCGGRTFEMNPIRALVTNPMDPVTVVLPADSPQLILRIEEDALESCLIRMLGRTPTTPLHFDPELDLASEAANRWHASTQLLQTEIYYRGSLTNACVGVASLEEFVMSSLLLMQPSTCLAELVAEPGAPGRRTVRRARDYIDTHLCDPLTMAEIAEFSGASVRSIQQGFHEELHLSPMAYLREQRLERVHDQLIDSQRSDGITVAEIAEFWGFHQLGSFAGLYRRRWGESPSETLRR